MRNKTIRYPTLADAETGNRGYLPFKGNTKFISSNVLDISVISRVRRTSKIVDIFNT